VITAATACAAQAAWRADFTPSAWNPSVGDAVSFAVCDSCLGGGAAYRYLWDFQNDGTVDLDTDAELVACAFNAPGFYEVKLTVRDAGGREQSRTKGIAVGAYPAYAVRELVMQSDGTVLVSITVHIVSEAAGVGVREWIPAGWQHVVEDPGSGLITPYYFPETRELDTAWGSVEPGDELVFSYSLSSSYASQSRALSGEVGGYVHGVHFGADVCGELDIP
jgi:PKD repeat protein